jgi:hypothetical protein
MDGSQSPLAWDDFEEQLLLAQDKIRQKQIDREDQVCGAGLVILSKHPGWNAIQAKICALNATILKRPFSGDIHQERKWAFKVFDKKAKLYLRTVSDTESADAFYGILPVLARAAFRDCRLGQAPQYCTPLSADAQSFERKVALHMERAKKKAYKQASQATINADRSSVTGDRQPQHLSLDQSFFNSGGTLYQLRVDE